MRLRLAALAALACVSRLPQLLSPNLLVDGDESVLGLMAKHFADGRQIPLFFWGQRYGFSTVEAGAAALAFRIAGVGPIALKVSMLAVWTIGALFLFLALTHIVSTNRAFWISAVLIVTPAWAVWSMKARGGYLTAFTASAMLLWIVAPRDRDGIGRWLAVGALTAVVWLAQPIWLSGILTIVAAVIVSRRRPWPVIACAATAGALVIAVKLIPVTSSETWAGPALGNPSIWGTRIRALQQVYITLTGSYYLTSAVDPPGPVTPILAWLWCGAIVAATLIQMYRIGARRPCWWSHVLFAALAATLLANWILLFARDGRYLLPIGALLVMLAGVELSDAIDRGILAARAGGAIVAAMLVAGSVSMYEFRNFAYLWTNPPTSLSETRRLQLVINALTSRGVHHVGSMNGLLDTQLIFYSNERVIARWASVNDRQPAYVSEVNRAIAQGEPVAVVGYTHTSGAPGCWDVPICTGNLEHLVPDPERIYTIDGKYFVYVGADAELLRKLRFEF